MKKMLKKTLYGIAGLAVGYLFLLIPDAKEENAGMATGSKPFAWNRDQLWFKMEELYKDARHMEKRKLDSVIMIHKTIAENEFALLQNENTGMLNPGWMNVEHDFFVLSSLVAVQQDQLTWLVDYYNRVRNLAKFHSQQWDMNDPAARNTLYKLLYGMRAAFEEVLLQSDRVKISPAMMVKKENTVTPAASIFGIEVHSGDLLVSRGGAEVSALISRGNDFPGNFSHVAFIYVN